MDCLLGSSSVPNLQPRGPFLLVPLRIKRSLRGTLSQIWTPWMERTPLYRLLCGRNLRKSFILSGSGHYSRHHGSAPADHIGRTATTNCKPFQSLTAMTEVANLKRQVGALEAIQGNMAGSLGCLHSGTHSAALSQTAGWLKQESGQSASFFLEGVSQLPSLLQLPTQ